MKQPHVLLVLSLIALSLIPTDCYAGEWGLGIGIAAQRPPQKGTYTQVVALPFPSYEGERLSLGFGSIGYALANTERFRFAVEGQLRFDGYDPDDSQALAGLEERDVTLDAGFSITAPAPKRPTTGCGIVLSRIGTRITFRRARSMPLEIADGTSRAFPVP